jgi:hypothetical protein
MSSHELNDPALKLSNGCSVSLTGDKKYEPLLFYPYFRSEMKK